MYAPLMVNEGAEASSDAQVEAFPCDHGPPAARVWLYHFSSGCIMRTGHGQDAACGKCGAEQLVRRHSLSACVLGVPQRADGEVDLPAQAGCCDGCCFPKVKSAAADRHGDAACPVVLCPDKLKFHLILKQFPVAVRWPLATRDVKWVIFSSLRAGLAWSAITCV